MGKKLFRLPFFVSSIALFGCGGGGNENTSQNPPPAPPPQSQSRVYQPITSVPPAVYPDLRRQQVFSRINEIRQQVGLGLFAQSTLIDRVAESHAKCSMTSGCAYSPHEEIPGGPGFTGITVLDRVNSTGYGAGNATEGMNYRGDLTGQKLVDDQLNTVYHRVAFFDHRWTHIGLGWADRPLYPLNSVGSINFVFDWAYPSIDRQGAPNTPYVVWPQPNSIASAVKRIPEIPDPRGGGYPVSVQVDPEKILRAQRFELREDGALVPSYLLTYDTDENLKEMQNRFFVALSPRVELKSLTNYSVVFEGSVDDQPLNLSWSFSTPDCKQIAATLWECK